MYALIGWRDVQCFCNIRPYTPTSKTLDMTGFQPLYPFTILTSYWFHNAGRGPIIAISPLMMLKIFGNSSRLVFLRNLPTFVMYWSGFPNRCVGVSLGVSIRIVRNFKILKWVLLIPTLFCLKKIGPGVSNFIAINKIKNTGDKMTAANTERTKSITLFTFKYSIQHPYNYFFLLIIVAKI